MASTTRFWVLGVLLSGLAGAQTHRLIPTELTVPLGTTATFQILISPATPADCNTRGNITSSPVNVVNINPGLISFSGPSATFTVSPIQLGVTILTLTWLHSCPASPGSPSFSVSITRQMGINVPAGPAGGAPRTGAANPNAGTISDPVSTVTGELLGFDTSADLWMAGPLPLEFRRYHASLLRSNDVSGALGANWMHNFDVRLALAGTTATVTLFRGKKVAFNRDGANWQLAGRERLSYQLVSTGSEQQFLDPSENLVYTFNAAGALTRVADRNGNALTVTPAGSGQGPERVTDGRGRTLTFTYTGARLTRVEDQSGRRVTFEHQGELLAAAVDANAKRTVYEYTSAGNLIGLMTAEVRPAGNRPYTQQYNSQGQVSRQTDSRGNATALEYQTAPGATRISEPQGVAYTHLHDAQGSLMRLTDAAGLATSFTYDANDRLSGLTNRLGDSASIVYHQPSGLPASVTDLQGNTTTYSYAAQTQGPFTFYNPTRIGYADGAAFTMTHDAAGNVLTRTNQAGHVWRATYNAQGQTESLTNPAGGTATFTYHPDSLLASARNPFGDTTTFSYDNIQRPAQTRRSDGATRSFEYDGRNNLLRDTDERGNPWRYGWDDNNNPRSAADAAGAASTMAYDTDDRLATETDPLGKVTRYAYDANGRVQTVTNPAGNRLTYTYDSLNRLTTVVDAEGKGSTFGYDAEGRLTGATDALGRAWRFARDKLGRATRVTTPQGESFDRTYDQLGRPLANTDPLARAVRHRYDSRGLLTDVEMPAGLLAFFERNELGLPTRITDPNGNSWRQGFDRMGRLTSRTDPLGRTSTYAYNSRMLLSRLTWPIGDVQYTYDAAGNLTRAAHSDGTELTFTSDVNNRITAASGLTLGYDAAGRITSSNGLRLDRDDAGRIAAITYASGKTARYTYDTRGLLRSVTDWVGGATELSWDDAAQLTAIGYANGVQQVFTYDRTGRLTGTEVRRGSLSLASIALRRDAAGQIIGAERTPPPADAPSGALPLAYDAAHQVSGYTYDELGRVTSESLRRYTWDVASRLRSYAGADGTAAFTYDAWGQRISRAAESYALNYALPLPSVAVVRSGGADQRYYLHLPDGTLLAAIDASGNTRRFYHFDETGSTLLLTGEAGAVTDSYGLTPYGETIARTGSTENPFTFLGAFGVMQEGSTGLYYMRARYYDSATARFLSRDPVTYSDPRALNPYQYALGNPLSFGDPSGLSAANLLKTATGIEPSAAWKKAVQDWWDAFLGLPATPNPPNYGDTSKLCPGCTPAQQKVVDDWWRAWVDQSVSKPPKP